MAEMDVIERNPMDVQLALCLKWSADQDIAMLKYTCPACAVFGCEVKSRRFTTAVNKSAGHFEQQAEMHTTKQSSENGAARSAWGCQAEALPNVQQFAQQQLIQVLDC
eukprot:1160690-Pelagomonas_calceolata.AAC.20